MTCSDDRATAPVLGAAILLAIGVGIVAFVGVAALDATPEDPGEDRAAVFDADFDAGGPTLQFTHVTGRGLYGERVVVEDEDGNAATWRDIGGSDAVEGESITLGPTTGPDVDLVDLCAQNAGYTYRLVRETASGERIELLAYSLPDDPAACP